MSELFALADDLMVIADGVLKGPFNPDESSREEIGHAMVSRA